MLTGFVVMGVKWWWKEVGLVPTHPLGQSRPFEQGGAGVSCLLQRLNPVGEAGTVFKRVGGRTTLSWFSHILSVGSMGD